MIISCASVPCEARLRLLSLSVSTSTEGLAFGADAHGTGIVAIRVKGIERRKRTVCLFHFVAGVEDKGRRREAEGSGDRS